MTVGAELAQARQRLKLSLEEISATTKISVERLTAIEQMDETALPAFVYLKGFLKAYAAEVGLDAEDVAQRYIDEVDIRPAATAPTEDERELVASTLAAGDRLEAADTGVPDDDVVESHGVSHSDVPDDDAPIADTDATLERELIAGAFFKPYQPNVDATHATPASTIPRTPSGLSLTPMLVATLIAVLIGVGISVGGVGLDRLFATSSDGAGDEQRESDERASIDAAPAIAARGNEASEPAAKTASPDVTGEWLLTNRVESARLHAYKNLEFGFQLQLEQDGDRVTGTGKKWTENGREIPASERAPISVEGRIDGDRLTLKFTERGAKRTSGGSIDLRLADEDTLRGSFSSDAANARGTSEAKRM